MRRLVALAFTAALVACTPFGSGQPDGPPSWKLAWGDEFDGTTLNAANWSWGWFGCTPVQAGNEWANYAPSQVVVANGELTLNLIAKSNTCNGTTRPYLSGAINGRGKVKIGPPPIYIETRVWLDGNGSQIFNWPVVWTNGHDGTWPANGELDLVEGLGGAAQVWHGPSGQGRVANFGAPTGWHVYGALWEPGKVTAFFDGHKVGTYASSNVVSAEHYPIIAEQAGVYGGPTRASSSMRVDFIRVWKP